MYWLPLLLFILHIAEEFMSFPAWATRHFGATSRAWYVYSHIALIAMALPICHWAQHAPPQTWGSLLGTAFMWTLVLNAVFHVVTTLHFREYSPGVVTGVFLFFPAAIYIFYVTVQKQLLTPLQIAIAMCIATLVQVAVVGSLYLHIDIDWRLRKPMS